MKTADAALASRVETLRWRDGRIEMQQAGKAQPVVTSVDRAYFSALRTRALNSVRDRERTARHRMISGKAVAR